MLIVLNLIAFLDKEDHELSMNNENAETSLQSNPSLSLNEFIFKLGHIVIISILLFLIFVSSPMRLNKDICLDPVYISLESIKNNEYKCKINNQNPHLESIKTDSFAKQIILEQLKKANQEVEAEIQQEISWFRLKYSLVGVLFLGFFVNAFLGRDVLIVKQNKEQNTKEIESQIQPIKQIDKAIKSPATSLILAISTIIALTIDMQTRAGKIITNQLGTWISEVIEPLVRQYGFISWETFLRISSGFHSSPQYLMIRSANNYWITIILFSVYLYATWSSNNDNINNKINSQFQRNIYLLLIGLFSVFATLFVCALSYHYVPPNFEVIPFAPLSIFIPDHQITYQHPSLTIPVYTGLFWVLLVESITFVKLPTSLALLQRKNQKQKDNQGGKSIIHYVLFKLKNHIYLSQTDESFETQKFIKLIDNIAESEFFYEQVVDEECESRIVEKNNRKIRFIRPFLWIVKNWWSLRLFLWTVFLVTAFGLSSSLI